MRPGSLACALTFCLLARAVQFGVRGLTEALQTECYAKAPHVHVACVMPGGVKTGIVRNAFENDSGADKRFQLGADLTADEAAEWILGGVATNDSGDDDEEDSWSSSTTTAAP